MYNRRSLPLSLDDLITTTEAWLLLWGCRIGLSMAPFPRVLQCVQFCAGRYRSSRILDSRAVVRGIHNALPFTLRASCLTQALAGWIMLNRHGASSRVRIGVASPARHGFSAHAWLECGGEVILGDIGLEPYNVIWTLPTEQG